MKATELPEFVANFTEIIKTYITFGNDADTADFNEILYSYGAYIAGGSVLAATKWPVRAVNDFDIYVPISRSIAFFKAFIEFIFRIYGNDVRVQYTKFNSSLYCSSFLRRNGIKQVHRFVLGELIFDIMTVRNRKRPIDVVNNFDLTFCQTWWDGERIWASHPDDVRSMKGKLQGDYRILFLQRNKFIAARVKKYITNGYAISLDEFTADEIRDVLDTFGFNKVPCQNPARGGLGYSAWEDPAFCQEWAIRVLKKGFLGQQYLTTIGHRPPNDRSHRLYPSESKFWKDRLEGDRIRPGFTLTEDDGYDTDDVIENDRLLLTLADEKYIDPPGFPELATDLTRELKFHRTANLLIRDAVYPFQDDNSTPAENFGGLYYGRVNPLTGEFIRQLGNVSYACNQYYKALRKNSLRIANEDYLFASEGDTVYDLHKHPLEGAINQENLVTHLDSLTGNPNNAKCYWRPEPGDSPRNCTQELTLKDIFFCVDYRYFFRYKRGKQREDQTLQLNLPRYDQILYNARDAEPVDPAWPNIFHQTVCPFCLESVTRDAGCVYMTHPNPLNLPQSESPFCNPNLVNRDLLNRYRQNGRQHSTTYLENIREHVEFCIECGRPSFNHQHALLGGPGFIEGRIEQCTGGGRPELFARVLEIRRVYSEGGDRNRASDAANAAPLNPQLIQRGAYVEAIAAAQGDNRTWSNAVVIGGKRYSKTRRDKRKGSKTKSHKAKISSRLTL
jgi:hypothetical protein